MHGYSTGLYAFFYPIWKYWDSYLAKTEPSPLELDDHQIFLVLKKSSFLTGPAFTVYPPPSPLFLRLPKTLTNILVFQLEASAAQVVEPLDQLKYNHHTVCPGSSDPPEKILYVFASENEVYNVY